MAASSQSQQNRCCVFVGNIPYDATEEQLKQICEEVGPVVSFRLVIDRETGKPKGYGFCEYKDEETALSARRNLQGYEINGRQLRVDFAENGKNSDRNRDPGRGGPGNVANIDQKQFGGPAILVDPTLHQPVGDSLALTAATLMAGTLNQIGLDNQSSVGTEPLTHHLAKMSRSQLGEIMSEIKAMALQNREQARQLLLAFPNLLKAVFQAQIMLGMVSQQTLKMPSIGPVSGQLLQPLPQSGQPLSGLPPLPHNKMLLSFMPDGQETKPSAGLQNQFLTQSQVQRPPFVQNQVPVVRPHQMGNISARPQIQVSNSPSLNQQVQPPLLNRGQANLGYSGQLPTNIQPPALIRPQPPSQAFQSSGGMTKNIDPKVHALISSGNAKRTNDSAEQMGSPPKLVKLEDGRATVAVDMGTRESRSTPVLEERPNPVNQATQVPLDVESALLQQVLNLTPEQLSSLPPDQQSQVIQLQQMLRQAT